MKLGNFSIRDVQVDPGLVLAPMSGVTNTAFRRLILRENPGAVGLCVTEFISIEGLTRKNKRSVEMMKFYDEERPLSIQIFGHDIGRMVDAALMVQETGADVVDINSGCPVPKVVKRGGGCELMRQPQHMEKILTEVAKAVSIPLTLKIRSGWDEDSKNALEIAKIAEGSGVQMLAIHGRTRKSLYRGEADWDIVRDVAEQISIPVVGSGDIVDTPSAKERLKTGISGLMIGRGALTNPWIFSQLKCEFEGSEFKIPPPEETAAVMFRYYELLKEEMPEKGIIGKLKQFTSQVTRRVPGSKETRKELCRAQSVSEFLDLLHNWKAFLEENSEEIIEYSRRQAA